MRSNEVVGIGMILFWCVLMAGLFSYGCIPATQQEIQTLTNTVNQIIPAVRDAVSTSSEETRDKVEVVLGQVEEVNEAVATVEDPIDAVSKGWDASKPFNPYYGYGAAILAVLRALQVGKQKKETDVALEEVVIGVEKSKQNGGDLKKAFLAAESVTTMDKVAKIRNRLV